MKMGTQSPVLSPVNVRVVDGVWEKATRRSTFPVQWISSGMHGEPAGTSFRPLGQPSQPGFSNFGSGLLAQPKYDSSGVVECRDRSYVVVKWGCGASFLPLFCILSVTFTAKSVMELDNSSAKTKRRAMNGTQEPTYSASQTSSQSHNNGTNRTITFSWISNIKLLIEF